MEKKSRMKPNQQRARTGRWYHAQFFCRNEFFEENLNWHILIFFQLTGNMDVGGVEKLKGVDVIAYKTLASTEIDDETVLSPPTPEDVAIIM